MNEDVRTTIQPGLVRRYLKFPLLEREDRVALAERVSKSSAADVDFVTMMALAAVLIASILRFTTEFMYLRTESPLPRADGSEPKSNDYQLVVGLEVKINE